MATDVPRRVLLGLAVASAAAACTTTTNAAPPTNTPSTTTPPTTTPPTNTTARSVPPAATGPATAVARGPGTRNQVALTFHGQGDPKIATAVLDVLAAHHAAVTVMAVGTWLAANPSMAATITAAGHELGNHTWTHPDLASLPEPQIRAEIGRCRDTLMQLSGGSGNYFRQSSAQHSTPLIRQVAGQLGYPVCLSYDVDSLDWTDPGSSAIRRAVAAATAGSIVSMHFGHQGTVAALPAVLDDLAGRGLAPVAAATLLHA